MKRYISSVIIVLVAVFSIGTYYVQIDTSASVFPKYTFKTIEGNDSELNPVIVHGYYEDGGLYEQLTIQANQTNYKSQASYLDNLIGFPDVDIEELVSKYRSFMRDKKKYDNNSYYEDSDFLAYASVIYKEKMSGRVLGDFKIAFIEKKNKEETSFEAEIPNRKRYEYIEVEDVQLIQSKLQVVTNNLVKSNNDSEPMEIHVYTIDLANSKVENDVTLSTIDAGPSHNTALYTPADTNATQPSTLFLFDLSKTKMVAGENGDSEEIPSKTALQVYNYETNKLDKVQLPENVLPTSDMLSSSYFDGENLYILELTADQPKATIFNVNSQEIINEYTLPILGGSEGGYSPIIKNNRIYILKGSSYKEDMPTTEPVQLLIVDLKTGKTLYKGEVTEKSGNQKELNMDSLYLDWLEVKSE